MAHPHRRMNTLQSLYVLLRRVDVFVFVAVAAADLTTVEVSFWQVSEVDSCFFVVMAVVLSLICDLIMFALKIIL